MSGRLIAVVLAALALAAGVFLAVRYWPSRSPRQAQDAPAGRSGFVLSLAFDVSGGGLDSPEFLQETVSILRKRIDPDGAARVTFAVLGGNRLEIRVPVRPEVVWLQRDFEHAMGRLGHRAVTDEQMRRAEFASPDRREGEIAAIAGSDTALGARLRELGEAHDAVLAARASGDEGKAQAAMAAQGKSRAELEKRNTHLGMLQEILRAPWKEPQGAEGGGSGGSGSSQEELAKLRKAHPDWAKEIDEAVTSYRKWAGERRILEDPEALVRLARAGGSLGFRVAPDPPGGPNSPWTSAAEADRYLKKLREFGGPEELRAANEPFLWFPIRGDVSRFEGLVTGTDITGAAHVLLYNQPAHRMLHQPDGAWRLARVYPTTDTRGLPAVGFEFDQSGARRFGSFTSAHKGRRLAILLDDEVYSAPVIREAISARGLIEMGGSAQPREVTTLVRILESGSLPVRLTPTFFDSEALLGPAIGSPGPLRPGMQAYVILNDDALLVDPATKKPVLPGVQSVWKSLADRASRLGMAKAGASLAVEPVIWPAGRFYCLAEEFDGNRDGKVTLGEWVGCGCRPEAFSLLDLDHDGAVTLGELEQAQPATTYLVTVAAADPGQLAELIAKTFGDSRQGVRKREFSVAKGSRIEQLGVVTDPTGLTRIAPQSNLPLPAPLRYYQGGVLIVVENVTPPMSQLELYQRLARSWMRRASAGQKWDPVQTVGLKAAGAREYSSLALLTCPGDPPAVTGGTGNEEAWQRFARRQLDLLTEAMRSEAQTPAFSWRPVP